MISPMDYDRVPHPYDRAHIARDVARYTLRHGNPILFNSFNIANGPNTDYTFGIIDATGHVPSQVVRADQLRLDATEGGDFRLFVQMDSPDARIVIGDTAKELGLRIAPREFTITLENVEDSIVPATDTRIAASTLQ